MSDARHPFSDDRVESIADESDVDQADLDDALNRIQRAIERDGGDSEYEYSSEHNFGWEDEDAYYLYGDGIWGTLGDELPLSADLAAAAGEVHRGAMLESATERGERESVEELFDDGVEPLVVTNTASEPPLYGQDV